MIKHGGQLENILDPRGYQLIGDTYRQVLRRWHSLARIPECLATSASGIRENNLSVAVYQRY